MTPAVPTASVEVTVTEAGTGIPLGGTSPGGPAPMTPGGGAAKGALVRLAPGGEVDTLWTSAEDTPQSLLMTAEGAVLATGGKGKLYRIRDDRSFTLLAVFTTEQLTAVGRRGSDGLVVAASGPGKVFGLDKRPAERGTFVSKPKDTETVSTWGRLRWDGELPPGTEIQVQTRSGNTQAPDATWTEWSSPYSQKDGQNITSERARFLQLRATLVGKEGVSPVLEGVTTAYLQRNLRPQMLQVIVHPPGEVFQKPISVTGDPEVLGLDAPRREPPGAARNPAMPAATAFSRKMFQRGLQTFSWRSEDRERRHPRLRRVLPGRGRQPLPGPAQGADGRRAGLGHLDRSQRPLPRQGRRERRAHATPPPSPSRAKRRAAPSTSTTRRP